MAEGDDAAAVTDDVEPARGWLPRRDARISVALVILTGGLIGWLMIDSSNAWARRGVIAAWVAWTMVPPAYFLWEWKEFTPGPGRKVEDLKYSQDLASKFWLAGVTVITAALLYASGGIEKLMGGL